MYDTGPFLIIRDIIIPCKVHHRVKLLVDSKQTVLIHVHISFFGIFLSKLFFRVWKDNLLPCLLNINISNYNTYSTVITWGARPRVKLKRWNSWAHSWVGEGRGPSLPPQITPPLPAIAGNPALAGNPAPLHFLRPLLLPPAATVPPARYRKRLS